MSPTSYALTSRFIIMEMCDDCGAVFTGFFMHGSPSFPVVNAQCPRCQTMTARQCGPPLFTMN